MDAQRRAEITGWDAREFSGGFSGLRRLVDREFSGAATDGMGWLFVFEGRVVGTADTDLTAFEGASGTVYEAPHESLALLFAMQEQGGEPRAKYYTNDTPLSEADRKLSQGGFTGYIELTENVLSGDYYVAYAGGESMAAAYVGNSRRLETGDDAFALADDEVGIYTVYEVELDVREIPDGGASGSGSSDQSGQSASTDQVGVAAGTGADAESPVSPGATDESADKANDGTDEPPEAVDASPASDGDPRDGEAAPDGASSGGSASVDDVSGESHGINGDDDPGEPQNGGSEGDGSAEAEAVGADRGDRSQRAEPAARTTENGSEPTPENRSASAGDGVAEGADRASDDDVFSEEAQWREQKSIPALDPSEASDPPGRPPESGGDRGSDAQSARPGTAQSSSPRSRTESSESTGADRSPEPRSTESRTEQRSAVSQRPTGADRDDRSERLERLEAALEAAESERDEIAAERDEIAAERDRLESEVSALREERDRLREELSTAREKLPGSDRTLSPAEARSGTNLFVRYDSKGGATLEDAHDGSVDRDALRENLRIEHHTSFETDGLVVDGRPYEEFLTETIEYGFTRWLVEDLPFEVSETGNQSVLRDLYDAIPKVDRAEIGGSVSIAIRENGEETREQRAFDLVLRDRMGNPLFVADLNDSRDPTAEGALESLVGNGRDIAESNDSFAAAFAVTESFFEPGALETASDAVGGGLFSRSKRSSFVKLSRKQGYHLCLVEARDGGFHMTVPDL